MNNSENEAYSFLDDVTKNCLEYLEIIDSFSGGYFMSNIEKKKTFYSPEWRKRLGLGDLLPEEEETAVMSLIHPDDVSKIMEIYENAFAVKSKKAMMDYRIKTVDSGYIWAHTKVNIKYGPNGIPLKLFGVNIDINGPKMAADALKISEAKYRMMIETAGEGVIIGDSEGIYTFVNRRMEEMLGYTAEEMLGKSCIDFSGPEMQPQLLKTGEELSKGNMAHGEFKFRRKDGSELWTMFNVTSVLDTEGRYVANLAMHTDITERKEKEKLNTRISEILESVTDAFYAVDDKWRLIYVNSKTEEWWNNKRDFLLGTKLWDVFPRSDNPLGWKMLNEVMECRIPVRWEAYSHNIKAWVDASAYPSADGGISIYFKDITERKKAEEKIRRQNEIIRIINKVYEKSVSCSTQKELGEECLVIIESAVGGDIGVVSKVDKDGKFNFISLRAEKSDMQYIANTGHPSPSVFYKKILELGKGIIVNNVSDHPTYRVPDGHFIIQSFLGAPFVQNGKILGLIGAANKIGGFMEEDLELLEAVTPSILEVLQRKRAEEDLRESEEKYRQLIESSPAGIYRFDIINGRFTSVNEAICRATGYSKEKLLAMNPTDLLDEKSLKIFKSREALLLTGVEPEGNVDYKIKTKEGKEIYAQFNTKFIRDKNGNPYELSAIANDITERVRMEQALSESEEKYRHIVEFAPAGIFRVGLRSGRFISVNDTICNITGYGREELLNIDPYELVGEQDRKKFGEGISKLITGGISEAKADYRIITKSGTEVCAMFNIRLVRNADGIPSEASVIAYDLTERIKMETAVNKALMREQVLNDLTSQLLKSDDPSEIMDEICRKSAEYIGCDVYFNHIVDKNCLKLNVHSKMDENRIEGMERFVFGEAISGTAALNGNPVIVSDIQNRDDEMTRKAKQFGLMSLACFPLKSGDEVIGTLSFGCDEKESFSADEISFMETVSKHIAIALSRMLILKELKESEKKALRLVEELKKADQDKDNFLSSVSHELRNPLATISAGLQLIEISGDKLTTDNTMEIINRQLSRLCRLADDLLELTRLTHDKLSIRKQRVELCDLISIIAKDNGSFFGEKGVSVRIQECSVKLYAEVDPSRIAQAVGNLLHNAAKYSVEGGCVILSVYPEERDAVISVSDNGVGIEDSFLPYIFEPFSQADTTIDRHGGGLGLGLSITKGIIELHGGSITARSEGVGMGSEFIIRLPLAPARENSNTGGVVTELKTVPLKILIIEDNKDYAGVLSVLLKKEGHDTFIAYDGIEGFIKASEISPDIIFCDIGLPGMSGYEVAVNLRRESFNRPLLVAITGYAGMQYCEEAQKAGFDRYITKPVDIADINKLIADYSEESKI